MSMWSSRSCLNQRSSFHRSDFVRSGPELRAGSGCEWPTGLPPAAANEASVSPKRLFDGLDAASALLGESAASAGSRVRSDGPVLSAPGSGSRGAEPGRLATSDFGAVMP